MEHISEILKKQAQTNTPNKNTDTLSGAEEPEEASPSSACPICKGAGFVHPRLSSGKPDYSRVIPCRCVQQELDKELKALLQRYSGLDLALLKKMTFENFKKRVNLPPEEQENLEEAYRTALNFAKAPEGWLVFQGETGCGKTHLAVAIANHRLKEGKPVRFEVVPDFLDHLRFTFSPERTVTYDQLFEEVKNAPLLILDDFGEQSTTPWAQEKLYQVINHRYNAQLPTVITTRLKTDDMDSPIASRFLDYQLSMIFTIMAPDYRTDATASRKKVTRGRKGRRG
jgi:DNA replication protein DnaC